jgi:RNA polymerase sigma-70 factor (ECF subfamily)
VARDRIVDAAMIAGELVADERDRATGVRDGRLIALAAGGDRAAFDLLIEPRLDRLFRMAFAITRSEADARDATQDACVLAWRELPRLRQPDRFDSWLSQILVNASRGLLRRAARVRVREISVDNTTDDRPAATPEPAIPAEADSVADDDAIRRAFARLDDATRTLLVLHHVEERPLAEIAKLTGSPVGTVKWRLSNARAALAKALKAERR